MSTTDGSEKCVECKVVVKPKNVTPVSSVSMLVTERRMRKGQTATLDPIVTPTACLADTTISFSSSDKSIVEVDNDGNVKAVGIGQATITVTANTFNGTVEGITKTATCIINVIDPDVKITGIVLDKKEANINIGQSVGLSAQIYPLDATNTQLIWTCDDETKASIIFADDTKRSVIVNSKHKPGVVHISAKSNDGSNVFAQCTINIADSEISVDDIPEKPEVFDENTIWVAGLREGFVYTGAAIKPVVNVYHGSKLLVEKVDYTLSYKNNTKANRKDSVKPPTVVIKLKGNYTGTINASFDIHEADLVSLRDTGLITATDVDAAVKNQKGINKTQQLKPVVMYMGKALKENKDYTLTYPDNSDGAYANAGLYKIGITGKEGSGFKNTIFVSEILKDNSENELMDLSKIKVTLSKNSLIFDGSVSPMIPEYILTEPVRKGFEQRSLVEGMDYTVSVQAADRIGTATIIFTALKDSGKYVGSKKVTYKLIAPKKTKIAINSENTTIEIPEKIAYQKGGSKPDIKVRMIDSNTGESYYLIKDKDYKISYSRNNKVSTADMNEKQLPLYKVTGIGNYSGNLTGNFIIVQQDISEMTVLIDDIAYSPKSNAYKKAKITVTDVNGTKLALNSDYVITGFDAESNIPLSSQEILALLQAVATIKLLLIRHATKS